MSWFVVIRDTAIALPTAQKLARHSTINLTMRYTHVDTEQRYKGLSALPGLGETSTEHRKTTSE